MREEKFALRCTDLSSQRPESVHWWRANDVDARAMTDQAFTQHVDALCQAAQTLRNARGERSADRIKERLLTRASETTRRNALDIQRLDDLSARIELRQAEAARRRWFVLGRLLARAVEEDRYWGQVAQALIERVPLTAHEARALGLSKTAK